MSGQISFNEENIGLQQLYFNQTYLSGHHSGMSSGVLKAFLEKGGFIEAAAP